MSHRLAKYFLFLCILLTTGYCTLSPFTYTENQFVSISNVTAAIHANQGISFGKQLPAHAENNDYKVFAEENEVEEDKFVSFRKHLELASCWAKFDSQIPQYLFHFTRHQLALFKLPAYQPSDKYLELEIFRI